MRHASACIQVPMFTCYCLFLSTNTFVFVLVCERAVVFVMCALKTWYLYRSIVVGHWPEKKSKKYWIRISVLFVFLFILLRLFSPCRPTHTRTHTEKNTYTVTKISIFGLNSSFFRRRIFHLLDFFRVNILSFFFPVCSSFSASCSTQISSNALSNLSIFFLHLFFPFRHYILASSFSASYSQLPM